MRFDGHERRTAAGVGWKIEGGPKGGLVLREEKVGGLNPGKFADLMALSENPLTVDPDAIRDIDVLMSMVGGRDEHCSQTDLCPASQQLLTPEPAPRADIIFFDAQVVTIEPELP